MQASSPTWVFGATRLRFPGWSHTLPLTVGADSISARKRLRRRGVRRDEGIPPYDRPGGCGRPVWRVVFGRFVGEGFIPPLQTFRCSRVPGTMQASSPTWVCGATRLRFPGWSCTLPLTVGADSISARGCLRRRGVRRDEGIPPYDRPGGCSRSGLAGRFGRFVGAGFIPPGDLPVQQGPRDDASIVPYRGLS